jgi:dTDP-4-dehydrorhamnose 3,5-epimerase
MKSEIPGVVIRKLAMHEDSRGWLMELFRDDELPAGFQPAMCYISITHPGVARGPHEHHEQSDYFCFLSGHFRLSLWQRRDDGIFRETYDVGAENPVLVIVPPGVVHAYENAGQDDAYVVNFPDKLYAGKGKREPVDEIRHEDSDSEFKL